MEKRNENEKKVYLPKYKYLQDICSDEGRSC